MRKEGQEARRRAVSIQKAQAKMTYTRTVGFDFDSRSYISGQARSFRGLQHWSQNFFDIRVYSVRTGRASLGPTRGDFRRNERASGLGSRTCGAPVDVGSIDISGTDAISFEASFTLREEEG